MARAEDLIRDYLAERIADLPSLVRNVEEVREDLRRREEVFFRIDPREGGPSAHDLLRRIIARRNLVGLDVFRDLRLLGTEFKLLKTGLRGKQPSADILTIQNEMGVFFVPEIKQDEGAERQAVTELGAYSQGLQNRFWGLCPADHVWMPISTEWRTTVRAGFANEIVWGNRAILPMRCQVAYGKDEEGNLASVTDLRLELINVVDELSEKRALAQFARHAFDCLEIAMPEPVSDPRAFIEFIGTTASRLGLSGYVLYYEYRGDPPYPEPYVFHIAATNPFRAALKERELTIIWKNSWIKDRQRRLVQMRKDVGRELWHGMDIDLLTGNDVEVTALEQMAERAEEEGNQAEAERLRKELEDYESVQAIADANSNRLQTVFEELRSRLELFLRHYTLGGPSFACMLTDPNFRRNNVVRSVGYFGIMGEAVYERLIYEFRNAEGGRGPVIGHLGGDPMRLVSDPSFFFQFMDLMNYEHPCQEAYRGPDEVPPGEER